MRSTTFPVLDNNGFGIQSLDLQHTWTIQHDIGHFLVTPGTTLHLWHGPTSLDLPARVYDTYLDLQWIAYQSENTSILLGATPGLYGDFNHIDSTTFQWSGWLVGRRALSTRVDALGGVAYLRQLESHWLPMGGLAFRPDPTTRLELLFPRPKIAKRAFPSANWEHWVSLSGQYGGGSWSVEDTPSSNALVSYQDLRLAIGWEATRTDNLQLQFEMGYAFDRSIQVNNVPLVEPGDTMFADFVIAR